MDVSITTRASIFFVLKGRMTNGDLARRAGDGKEIMADGWYWIVDGMSDGYGPYNTIVDAREGFSYECGMAIIGLDGQKPF